MRRTLDDLAAEVRPMVFRLLDAGKPAAAAELISTYTEEADAALWHEVLALTAVPAESAPVEPGPDDEAREVVQATSVEPARRPKAPRQSRTPRTSAGQASAGQTAAAPRGRAAVGR